MSLVKIKRPGPALLLVFSLTLQSVSVFPSSNTNSYLAPQTNLKSLPASQNGPLNWFEFAPYSGNGKAPSVSNESLRYERKQLILTFLNEESSEERIVLEDLPPADKSPIEGELYVISDVHLRGEKGGGLKPWKYKQFLRFLDTVAARNGNLVINGDFLESYSHPGFLFEHLKIIYRKLRHIKRIFYISGNHDARFQALNGRRWKNIHFFDSLSIRRGDEVIHIEHGHKTDWWWHHIIEAEEAHWIKHPFSTFGKFIIRKTHAVEEHGFALSLRWVQFANVLKFVFILPIMLQLFWMDIRVRQLRNLMADEMGFEETMRPFWKRLLMIWELKRLFWELTAPKKGPVLHYVIGHYHEGDLVVLSWIQWLLQRVRTRVKLYFTAGRWVALAFPMKVKFTRIRPKGLITYENVEDFIPDGKKMTGKPPYRRTQKFRLQMVHARLNASL